MTTPSQPDGFDDELAAALNAGRSVEQVEETARLVAAYWRTLHQNGVDDVESVTYLTHQWVDHVMTTTSDDDEEPDS